MKGDCFPKEHHFLLNAQGASDMFSQVKSIYSSDNMDFSESLAETLQNLSNSYESSTGKKLLQKLDSDTLNYVLDSQFSTRYRAINKYLETIDPIVFEALCSFYLSLLGAKDLRITRRSNDQGIDFYGTLPYDKGQLFQSSVEKNHLIGQAKYYTAKVGTGEIREFIGSIELMKLKVSSGDSYSYRLSTEIKQFTKISPVFISSSSFSRDAIAISQKVGIKLVDVVQLITLLTSVDDIFDANQDVLVSNISKKLDSIKMAESASS